MTLPGNLLHATFVIDCSHCDYVQHKTGRWVKSVSKFVCAGCGDTFRITYDMKIALFEKHAYLDDG